ncbi:MAG TPA: AI-2E family transporter [Candidatus Limnocylindrales bacterium]
MTAPPSIPRAAGPPLLATAAFVVILAGMQMASTIILLVLLSVLVTIVVAPIASAIRRRGYPSWLGLSAALGSYVLALAVVGLITAVGVARLIRQLPEDTSDLQAALEGFADSDVARSIASAAASVAGSVAQGVLSGLGAVGYSVIIVAYLLLEAPRAPDRVLWAFNGNAEILERAVALAVRLRAYVVARAVLGGIAAVLDVIVLLLLGIPSALLWGVLAFLMNFVPNVGFLISMIPPAVLAFLVGGLPTAVAVIVAYVAINLATDYLIQPRFIGSAVDLSPVVVTISLLFWVVILGGAGAIFAVPLTIIVAAVANAHESTRGVSRMLVAEVPASVDAAAIVAAVSGAGPENPADRLGPEG